MVVPGTRLYIFYLMKLCTAVVLVPYLLYNCEPVKSVFKQEWTKNFALNHTPALIKHHIV